MTPDPIVLGAYTRRVLRLELLALALLAVLALAWAAPDLLAWWLGLQHMTRTEAMRQTRQLEVLQSLGFTQDEAESLRRISVTLRRWHERECGTDGGCIERDETTGRAYWRSSESDRRYPVADRETGAKKRLAAIIGQRNERAKPPACALSYGEDPNAEMRKLTAYIQTDPRGAALYILRPGDVPAGCSPDSYYTRGICVY